MKDLVHVTYGRPDQTCRKTVTLNGGPFNDYVISLTDIGYLAALLRGIEEDCKRLSTPVVGHPHQLAHEIDFWQQADEEKQPSALAFDLPSYNEMAAYMDAEMARMDIARPTCMSPREVKAALILAGMTQTAFANSLGVSINSVSRVINGTLRSKRIEAELQKLTGKPLHDAPSVRGRRQSVWPGALGAAA